MSARAVVLVQTGPRGPWLVRVGDSPYPLWTGYERHEGRIVARALALYRGDGGFDEHAFQYSIERTV